MKTEMDLHFIREFGSYCKENTVTQLKRPINESLVRKKARQ
jgi:hypothetical protein